MDIFIRFIFMIYLVLCMILYSFTVKGQLKKEMFWHDAIKTDNIGYYRFADSNNYFDVTLKNNTAMSYVVYFPMLLNYPIPIEDLNSPFILNKKNRDSLILMFSGYRTHHINTLIREIRVSFTPDYLIANMSITIIRNYEEHVLKLRLKRIVYDDEKVIRDIRFFCSSYNSINGVKELKCVNYANGSIISAIFLVGGFHNDKSQLVPITFDRKSFKVLNNEKIIITDSIKSYFKSFNYEISISKSVYGLRLNPKISYYLYGKNKIMYYSFLYSRKLDDEFYHYGVIKPIN